MKETINVRLASTRNMYGLKPEVYDALERNAEKAGLENYHAPRNDTSFLVEANGHIFPLDYQGIMGLVRAGKVVISNPEHARALLYEHLGKDCAISGCRACADSAAERIEEHYGVTADNGWKEICKMYHVAI